MNKASKTKQTMPKSKQTQIAMVDQFPCNRINTNIQSYSVRILKERWDHKSIKVPEFQRNFAYDDIKRCNVITSLLAGLYIDSMTTVMSKDGTEWLCDGKHRLQSICDFIDNKFKYSTKGGHKNTALFFFSNKNLDGKYFKDFPDWAKVTIMNAIIPVVASQGFGSITEEEVMNAVMIAKNSCANNMSPERIKLNTYMAYKRASIGKYWHMFNQSFKFGFDLKPEVLNMALNSNPIAEIFRRVSCFLPADSTVENFVARTLTLGKSIDKQTIIDMKKKMSVRTATNLIKHVMLCAFVLTISKKNCNLKPTKILHNLEIWDSSKKNKNNTNRIVRAAVNTCSLIHVILACYFDKIDWKTIKKPDIRPRSKETLLYLLKTYANINKNNKIDIKENNLANFFEYVNA